MSLGRRAWSALLVAAVLVAAVLVAPEALAYEQPTIRDTDYPYPPDALFVAPDGDDTGPGTAAQPLRTVTRAVERAAAGATVVLRAGVYREAVPHVGRRITLQPHPHEQAWLKGSVVVTDWVADGSVWRHDGWTHEFAADTYSAGAFQPAYPHAGRPDMVFVDGEPLAQVGSRVEVVAGTFFVDERADRLTIGTDPSGRLVEAAAEEQALVIGGSAADGSPEGRLATLRLTGRGGLQPRLRRQGPGAAMLDAPSTMLGTGKELRRCSTPIAFSSSS